MKQKTVFLSLALNFYEKKLWNKKNIVKKEEIINKKRKNKKEKK